MRSATTRCRRVQYKLVHSEARLSDAERQQLEQGIVASWTKDPPGK